MKKTSVKRLASISKPEPAAKPEPPKVTREERLEAELLMTRHQMLAAQLAMTPEMAALKSCPLGQQLDAAQQKLAEYGTEIAKRYGFSGPITLDPDGTIRSVPGG